MTTDLSRTQESYLAAETIMRKRAVSFYGAFRFLPAERFRSVTALYAFCRHADDLADSVTDTAGRAAALESLGRIRTAVQALAAGEVLPDLDYPVWWAAFIDTMQHYPAPVTSLLAQLEGQRTDLSFKDLETLDDLIVYSRLVAGSVGTMMLPLLIGEGEDSRDPALAAACENLGVAMQITNILRDVGEDLRIRDRIYIPSEMLRVQGVARAELKQLADLPVGTDISKHIPDGFIRVWEDLAATADSFYRDYLPLLPRFHADARLPLVMSQLTYQAIADEVRNSGYNCLTKRNYTSQEKRMSLLNDAKDLIAIHS